MEENNQQDIQEVQVEEKKGINPFFIFGGLVLVALVGGVFILGKPKQNTPAAVSQVESLSTQAEQSTQPAQTPSGPVKEFTVDGTNFAFNPSTITVNKGDTVKITFRDDDGLHNLVIDGYNVATDAIGPGKTSSVTFVADQAGSFEYYCSVANHRDLGMTGTLIVK